VTRKALEKGTVEMMTRTNLRRFRRLASRGVTLIEILIVLAIIGLIAGGVAVVAIPKYAEAQKKQAKNDVLAIHPVAEKYRVDHSASAGSCVTAEQLKAEKELSPGSKITDPWDTPYAIRCAEDETFVISFGPDKKEGTADDIKIPEGAPAAK